ncbi:MAG: hypothetical protein Q9185_005604 [Variospora sp. 1 TL-2023]
MDRLTRHASSYRSICAQCRRRLLPVRTPARPLSTSTPNAADTPDPPLQPPIDISAPEPAAPTQRNADPTDPRPQQDQPSILSTIRQSQSNNAFTRHEPEPDLSTDTTLKGIWDDLRTDPNSPHAITTRLSTEYPVLPEPHHLHIYSTRHNTHITLTKPDRNPIISVSAGTIGFRKAARGTYDAGYQLGAYVMGRIQQQGLLSQIQHLEVVLRDFGPGREAVTKILLGSEGRNLRGRVVRVCDATRLKFGGTRSKNARRL